MAPRHVLVGAFLLCGCGRTASDPEPEQVAPDVASHWLAAGYWLDKSNNPASELHLLRPGLPGSDVTLSQPGEGSFEVAWSPVAPTLAVGVHQRAQNRAQALLFGVSESGVSAPLLLAFPNAWRNDGKALAYRKNANDLAVQYFTDTGAQRERLLLNAAGYLGWQKVVETGR
jgi:hypothetical protein